MTIHKWGGLASSLIAVSFVVASWIYLTGNLQDAAGVTAYHLADFLSGLVLSASLITLAYVLRELVGRNAHRRMDLALLAAVLSAAGMAAVAFIRASNRHYHLMHPELSLENSTTVLIVWTTLVTGMNSLGFHFLGWTYVLLGSAFWTSRFFSRTLSVLYLLAGFAGWFVFLFQELEGFVLLLGTILGVWQGVFLLRNDSPRSTQAG